MLELCFDRSVRGALRVAQHCGTGRGIAFTTIIGSDGGDPPAKKKLRQARQEFRRRQEILEREAVPLGGSPEDVLALALGLDMGDIREPLGEERREQLRQWYGGDGTGRCDEALRAADEHWRDSLEAAERLSACAAGDIVRIWADPTPHSACGLLHAAALLEHTAASVHVVFLPPWRERPDGVTEIYDNGWGEVAPELFGRFCSLERPVPRTALTAMAIKWRELQQENAPLRAVVNGRVCGVGEDFYDGLIRRHLPEGQAKIGQIIGEVLGRERPGIGDAWLEERIRRMLGRGELRMVLEDRERFYGSVVERA